LTLWTQKEGYIWPVVFIFGGLIGLWFYANSRKPEPVFWGVTTLGLGCFFFLFTLELRLPILGRVEWSRMAEFWPGVMLIVSLAFLAQFALSGFRHRPGLYGAILALTMAVVAFAFTLGFLSRTFARQLLNLWPLIVILVGAGVASRFLSPFTPLRGVLRGGVPGRRR